MATQDGNSTPRRPANLAVAIVLMALLFPVIASVALLPFRLVAYALPLQSMPYPAALALWGVAVLVSLASAAWCCRAIWRRLPS